MKSFILSLVVGLTLFTAAGAQNASLAVPHAAPEHAALLPSAQNAIDQSVLVESQQVVNSLKSAELQYEATQLDVNNAALSLTQVKQVIQNARKNLQSYREQEQELLFFSPSVAIDSQKKSLAEKMTNEQATLAINQQRQKVLLKTVKILQNQLTEEKNQLTKLRDAFKQQQKIVQQVSIEKQVAELNRQQNYYLNKIVALNKSIDAILKNPQANMGVTYQDLVKKLFIAQENSNLVQINITLTHDKAQLTTLKPEELGETQSVTDLNQARQDLDDLTEQLSQTEQLIANKLDLLRQRQTILEQQGLNSPDMLVLMKQITGRYRAYGVEVQQLEQWIINQKITNTENLAKALARRQGLPGFSLFEWYALGKGFIQLEVLSYQSMIGLAKDITANLLQLSWLTTLKWLTEGVVLAFFSYHVARWFKKKLIKLHALKVNFKSRFFIGVVRLINAHLYLLVGFAWFLLLLVELHIGEQWFRLVAYLLATYLVFSVAFSAARVGLYENLSCNKGDDVKLYRRLFWTLVFGAVVSVCLVLSQQLNVMYEIHDFFNRAFTFFILILASMLLKAWQVVPQLIIPHVNAKHYYLIRVTKLLGVLIPLIILSNALIGIIGYVELAWTISKYEGIFALFAIAYLIGKGLLNEGLTFIADFFISHFRAGWLLTEAVLKPLSKWLHVAFFIGVGYLLLYSYGITQQAFFAEFYYHIMHFTLIRFSTTNITLWVLIKAGLVALIFVWAVHWSREFCYRRLYLTIKDIGARNSLAIFTQYGIVLLGVLVTLKVLQIDLTVLAFVFSGLAIGIGFGLRDLANNFSCGLLLLIERPMRRGDTVSIGVHEGVVVNIGMRAITLISSDNGEVVVPNSEAFSKIFVNWTRQDDVVRCEVIVKVSRDENPTYLSGIIEAAVKSTDGVLTKPVPAILLKSLQDTVLEFEIRFHINYRIHDSRTMMKSRVLFNIWQSFDSLGVKAPHPQHDIHIKEFPSRKG